MFTTDELRPSHTTKKPKTKKRVGALVYDHAPTRAIKASETSPFHKQPSEAAIITINSSDSVIDTNSSAPEDLPEICNSNSVNALHDAPVSDSEFRNCESNDKIDQAMNPEFKIHASYNETTDYLMPRHGATNHVKPITASLQVPVEVSRMIANISIDSHAIEALLDSGSERSYIAEAAYLTIQGSKFQNLRLDPTSTHGVTLVDSGSTYTKGGAPFRIEIGGRASLTWLSVLSLAPQHQLF